MTESHQPEDVAAYNERSLQKLAWAIEASVGQFKLFLARCNYTSLRSQLVERLQELTSVEIRILELKTSEKTLYARIQAELDSEQPDALMVFGLESVGDLDELLSATNQVREEFRKNFHFPLVLWVNDEVMEKLLRFAPDFESWAITTEFVVATDELVGFLRETAEQFFAVNFTVTLEACREIKLACHDLQSREQVLDLELRAIIESLLGLTEYADYANRNLDIALEHYQKGLELWQQSNNLERQGKLLRNIAFCYYLKALRYREIDHQYWQSTQHYIRQCLEVLEQAQRPDLVANSILSLGRVLRRLQDWEQLQILAQKALQWHQSENRPIELAQDYGFLAEVALAKEHWNEAKEFAQKSLEVLSRVPSLQSPSSRGVVYDLPDISVISYDPSRYHFILAQSQEHLDQLQEAIANLEEAKEVGSPEYDTQLYLDILYHLQKLYFEQKEYLKAFEIKLERQSIEQQYGLRAFVGAGRIQAQRQAKFALTQDKSQETIAPEITASGRQLDVERLVGRIGEPSYKLIIIHGQSGVGKSSLVNGGLVPALKQKTIGTSDVLPVPMRVYTNWVEELGKLLTEALLEKGIDLSTPLDSEAAILAQLEQSDSRHLRTVLIFDQFEEFFFVYPTPGERRQFFEFVGECLKILPVKVILSLREDYLHYLLEYEHLPSMETIGNDILIKNVRYRLGNFSAEDAKAIIQLLTERSSFYLDPALIEELVQDLAGNLGEVRPIELQIVGAQLQTDKITTLAEYRERGQKEELVKRYLAQVVSDCGTENKQAAELVLYLLTDEKGTRPLKTRAELERDLQTLSAADLTVEESRLDLIFKIFVGSGLVMLLPESPADRYQLVHDYIAAFIRQQQQPKFNELIAQLEQEKKQRLLEQEQRLLAEQQLKQSEQAQQILEEAYQKASEISRLEREGSNTLKQFQLDQFGSLLRAMRAGQDLKALVKDNKTLADYPTTSPLVVLTYILCNIYEHNQISYLGKDFVLKSLTSDGQWATSIKGNVAYLFKLDGTKIVEFKLHRESTVYTISPDGQHVLTREKDSTMLWNTMLWNSDGRKLAQFDCTGVEFSPSGKYLIIHQKDKIIKILNSDRQELGKIKVKVEHEYREPSHGYERIVWGKVKFSPDENLLIIENEEKEYSLRLYKLNGEKLAEFKLLSKRGIITSFSPDSQKLLVAGDDGIVKLWNLNSQKLIEFRVTRPAVYKSREIHYDRNNSSIGISHMVEGGLSKAQFSPDGERLVTVDNDHSIKLWNLSGQKLAEFGDYGYDGVEEVRFVQNGKNLLTVDNEGKVNLWSLDGKLISSFQDTIQSLRAVLFTPDAKRILIWAMEGTIRIWSLYGENLYEVKAVKHHLNPYIHLTNKQLIVLLKDNIIRFFNFEQQTKKEIKGKYLVRFSPNSKQLVTGQSDRSDIFDRLYSIQGKPLAKLKGHNQIWAAAFSPDGTRLVTAGDGNIRLWDSKGKLLRELEEYPTWVRDIQFSPNGQYLASRGDNLKYNQISQVILFSLNNPEQKIFIDDNKHSSTDMHFSPNGQYFVTAGQDDIVKLFNLNGQKITEFKANQNGVNKVKFGINSKVLATAGNDGTAKLWDITGKLLVKFNGHQGKVNEVQFSPDEQYLATAGDDGNTKLWNLTGEILIEIKGYNPINRLRFSPDKQRLVTQDGYTAKLWTLNGKLLAEYQDHSDELKDVEFSPDGNYLATASYEKIVLRPVEGLDELLTRGCSFLNDYFVSHPEELVQLKVCQKKSRNLER